jgi:hypothetical protein
LNFRPPTRLNHQDTKNTKPISLTVVQTVSEVTPAPGQKHLRLSEIRAGRRPSWISEGGRAGGGGGTFIDESLSERPAGAP